MAPLEPDLSASGAWPILTLGSKVVGVSVLLVEVIFWLREAASQLQLTQSTRAHSETRKKTVGTFAALTVASLLVLLYHGSTRYMYSLSAYAKMMGEEWPDVPFWFWVRHPESWPKDLMLGSWWQSVDHDKQYQDVAVGTARGLWWTQQQLLGSLAWSTFLGIEGHRRWMPTRLILSLVALSHVCGLSVAQNLSFVALLLSPKPVPRARSTSRRHSSLWTPRPSVYTVPLVIAVLSLMSMHTLVSSTYGWILGYVILLCQIWLGVASKIIPLSWGTVGENRHAMHQTYTNVYRLIAGLTFVHYARRTFVALYVNTPDSHSTKYNYVWNMHQGYERTATEMFLIAADRVLNAISHEPVISAAGWDVLLSGFSLCIWAAVRSLDASQMMRSILPIGGAAGSGGKVDGTRIKVEEGAPESRAPAKRGRGRPRKASVSATAGRQSARRRTVAHGSDSDDYVPPAATAAEVANMELEEEHGDEGVVEDAEAAALTWALALVGGLGLASTAVMGAELRTR